MSNQILPILDYKDLTGKISRFLKKEFQQRNKTSAVLGVSGGVDSGVVALLCKKAGLDLRPVFMSYGKISGKPKFNNLIEIDITSVVDSQTEIIRKKASLDKIDKGNIMARTRMVILYALARRFNGLVVGTENLSEYYLGYFTLHGDQASDINPIALLWKTQVMELAEYLCLPIKKPSAELYRGQTDQGELGFSYQEADPILYLYCVKKMEPARIIKEFDIGTKLVNKVIERVVVTEYKRKEVPRYEPN